MKRLLLLFCIATLSGCATPPPRPANLARGDQAAAQLYVTRLIQYEMQRNSVEGLSIALVDDQRIVWADGFGFADEGKNIPATANTVYRVGSISKLFTDVAAMQLAEEGWLDIDQPVRHYLQDFSIRSRFADTTEITPRQLMTHHAGLPRDYLKGFMTAKPAPFASLVDDLHDSYAAYPPDLVFSYSNIGISLLGAIIQKQGGLPFAEFMRRSLLVPLGMNNSSFDTGLSLSPLAATSYRGRAPAQEPALRDVPAGGLNSSVTDLGRFMSMVFADGKAGGKQILQARNMAEMLRPQNLGVPLDLNFRVGLGWMLSTLGTSTIQKGGVVAHHSGATAYFHSQMYLLPEHKLGVVVLSNSSTAGQVVDRIATETLSLALEAKTGIRQPDRHKSTPDTKPVPTATVRDFVGDYTTMAGFATIRACGNGLCARVADRNFDLIRGEDGLFRLDFSFLGIFHIDLGALGEIGISRRTVAGRELLVAKVGQQEMLVGQRLKPVPLPEAWRQYAGDYEIANLDGDHEFVDRISLVEDGGYLQVELTPKDSSGKLRMALLPVSASEAVMTGPLSDGGETIRNNMVGKERYLLYSGYRLRKIR